MRSYSQKLKTLKNLEVSDGRKISTINGDKWNEKVSYKIWRRFKRSNLKESLDFCLSVLISVLNVAIDMVCHFNCKIISYFQQREIYRETSEGIFNGIRSVKTKFQERSMRMTDAHHIHSDKHNSNAQVCFGETDKTNLQRYILCCISNIFWHNDSGIRLLCISLAILIDNVHFLNFSFRMFCNKNKLYLTSWREYK